MPKNGKVKKPRHRGVDKKKAFLSAYVRLGYVTYAAQACGMDRDTHYLWLKNDRQYVARFADARKRAADLLEDEAIRRAYRGVLEPIVYQGQFTYPERYDENGYTEHIDDDGVVTYTPGKTIRSKKPLGIRKYSDQILMFLLRGMMPEKYRDRTSTEVSGIDGGPIVIDRAKYSQLSDEELVAAIAIGKKLRPIDKLAG